MAAGDIIWFDQALVDEAEALHDMETGSFLVGLITNAVTPAATDADPRWSGGTTNYGTSEVTPGGNYTDNGNALVNPSVTLTGGLAMFDADDFSIAQNASNPTTARWAIVYNTAGAANRALFAVDLGSVLDLTTGAFSIAWNASGVMRKNQA